MIGLLVADSLIPLLLILFQVLFSDDRHAVPRGDHPREPHLGGRIQTVLEKAQASMELDISATTELGRHEPRFKNKKFQVAAFGERGQRHARLRQRRHPATDGECRGIKHPEVGANAYGRGPF